jgi:hypothetical protein
MGKQTRVERLLERLEQAASDLGLEVRYENISKPGYAGGLCRVKDTWVVILNKGAPADEKVETLAGALATRDTDGVFLPPDVRDLVDRHRKPQS